MARRSLKTKRVVRRALSVLVYLVLAGLAVVVVTSVALRWVQPPLTTLQAIRLVEGKGFERTVLPLRLMGPHLPRALIAAEDNLFCQHRGVDWTAFGEQWARFRAGERPRGASTITMQLTKNVFLWPDRSNVRKALELGLAPVVDLLVPKTRQLEIYLNQVELGPGIYGAEAAARSHFAKGAGALTAREAAVLMALLPAPLSFGVNERHVRAQAGRIQTRVAQLGPLLDCATALHPS